MSQITHQRLIEMEAEMDRFEQEILTEPSASDLPRVVIGSNTYNQVSAQLKMLRAQAGMSNEEREQKQKEVASQLKALRASAEAAGVKRSTQPDDDDDDFADEGDKYSIVGRNEPPLKKPVMDTSFPILQPPPPPPPAMSTPSFVPHQVRHRPPPPPPSSRPPALGPPRMRPPPPPPPHGRPPYQGMGPMGPGPMHGPPGPYPPMGPGPGGHMGHGPGGPMGGPPMRGPPMGMRPGFNMPGPHHMGSPPGPRMYGVSSGESHMQAEQQKDDKNGEEEKPKVIYSSAPVITVQKQDKEKKKKKKKQSVEEEASGSSAKIGPSEGSVVAAEVKPGASAPSQKVPSREPEDNLHVADMEIDQQFVPKKEKKEKKKKFVRMAAGTSWEDPSLAEWDPDDFRLFCGDLGNEVSDEVLARAFSKYSSFVKAKVVRDKRSNKTKGYGFVSFKDPTDYVRAMREMNGKYVGNRPIKLRKSTWKDRNIEIVKKKDREKKRLGLR